MKKTVLLTFLISLITTTAWSAVVKGYDAEKACDLYRIAKTDANNKVIINAGEVLLTAREAYGLSFRDMEINFNNREVLVQPTINIVLGFNRPLLNEKVAIEESNPDFTNLINQLNRHVMLFEKMCIGNGKVVYAKMYENKPDSAK